MPRYRYKCSQCEQISIIFHLINESVEDCPICLAENTISKQLTIPLYKNKNKQRSQKVGEITKKFIELNKEVLEKEKIKREDYDPT